MKNEARMNEANVNTLKQQVEKSRLKLEEVTKVS